MSLCTEMIVSYLLENYKKCHLNTITYKYQITFRVLYLWADRWCNWHCKNFNLNLSGRLKMSIPFFLWFLGLTGGSPLLDLFKKRCKNVLSYIEQYTRFEKCFLRGNDIEHSKHGINKEQNIGLFNVVWFVSALASMASMFLFLLYRVERLRERERGSHCRSLSWRETGVKDPNKTTAKHTGLFLCNPFGSCRLKHVINTIYTTTYMSKKEWLCWIE